MQTSEVLQVAGTGDETICAVLDTVAGVELTERIGNEIHIDVVLDVMVVIDPKDKGLVLAGGVGCVEGDFPVSVSIDGQFHRFEGDVVFIARDDRGDEFDPLGSEFAGGDCKHPWLNIHDFVNPGKFLGVRRAGC